MTRETVIVIDFGGQYNQLVARRVRECNVYCEIYSYKTDIEKIKEMKPKGIILTGGPNSCYEPDSPSYTKELFELGIPVLGLCYGAQLMMHLLGGKVITPEVGEYGKTEITYSKNGVLFEGLPENTASNYGFSSTPRYTPAPKIIYNYNITYNVNCTQPKYIKNNYDGNRSYNWGKANNANQAQPALSAKQNVDYTRDDMYAPAKLDFSSVLPKDTVELSDNATVNSIVSVPNDVIEYGVSVRGLAMDGFRFSDYFSALQFCNSYRNAGYQVSIYPIINGKVNPFCTYF